MQDLTKLLGTVLTCRKQFKIQFQHLNDNDETYFPVYYTGSKAIRLKQNEIIAWWWGSSIKIGIVSNVHGDTSLVAFISRNKSKSGKVVHAQVRHRDVVARFAPMHSSLT